MRSFFDNISVGAMSFADFVDWSIWLWEQNPVAVVLDLASRLQAGIVEEVSICDFVDLAWT